MSEITDNDFTLSDGERHHPLWVRLSAHLTQKVNNLRAQNDGPLSQDQTATMRGQINALKAIIALGDEPPRLDG